MEKDQFESSAASAKLLVSGVALFVVSAGWFLHFSPIVFDFPTPLITNVVVYLYGSWVSWQQQQFYSELSIWAGLFVSALMVLLSLLFFARRFYFLAIPLPLMCIFFLAFPFSYEKNNFSWGLSKWSDPLVQQFEPYDITEKLIAYEFKTTHPELEIPVFLLQYLLTPTFLVGVWSAFTLYRKPVRSLFRHSKQTITSKNMTDSHVYCAALSQSYGILMALFLVALLPTTLLNIFDNERQVWMNPPPNIYWNILFLFLSIAGVLAFYTKEFYFFALLLPVLFLTTIGTFISDITLSFWVSEEFFYGAALITIAVSSRLILSLLGLWIWWKNFIERKKRTEHDTIDTHIFYSPGQIVTTKKLMTVLKNKWVILGILSIFVVTTRFAIMPHLYPKPKKSIISQEDRDNLHRAEPSNNLESGIFFAHAVACEKEKKYKEALENYREYHELELTGDGADLGRVHYFLGNYEKSAKIYCRTLEYYREDASRHFHHTTLLEEREQVKKQVYKWVKFFILSNEYGLKQPFTTFDEMIRFLEKTEKRIPTKYEYHDIFNYTINYLRELQQYEKNMHEKSDRE